MNIRHSLRISHSSSFQPLEAFTGPSSSLLDELFSRSVDTRNTEATTDLFEDSASIHQSLTSIGSFEMQTGLTPGTFVEIFRQRNRSDSFSGTIVSSVPSNTQVELLPPPLEQPSHVWAMMPKTPNLNRGNDLSITTTESLYHNVISIDSPNNDDASIGNSSILSLRPSLVESWNIDFQFSFHSNVDSDSRSDHLLTSHDRAAFVNVANRLQVAANPNPGNEWFSRFTEQDWIEFRSDAEMILRALDETPRSRPRILALPPPAPHLALCDQIATENSLDARNELPAAFVCSFCNDLIVGATSLSCGCPQSTVCTQCWEAYSTTCEDQCSDGLYVVDERRGCPFCDEVEVFASVPCHALDVAILHVVKALPPELPIQARYYYRLNSWRDEVIRRQSQFPLSFRSQSNDELLVLLIQQEEELLWNKKRRFWQTPLGLFFGEVAVAIAASVVFLVMARRP